MYTDTLIVNKHKIAAPGALPKPVKTMFVYVCHKTWHTVWNTQHKDKRKCAVLRPQVCNGEEGERDSGSHLRVAAACVCERMHRNGY